MKIWSILIPALCLCFACKTALSPSVREASVPAGSLGASLTFTGLEAADPRHVSLDFDLALTNRRSGAVRFEVSGWQAALNGRSVEGSLNLGGSSAGAVLGAGRTTRIPVKVELDLQKVLAEANSKFTDGKTTDSKSADSKSADWEAAVNLDIRFIFGDDRTVESSASALAIFSRILEPNFTITAIAIQEAELINTRLKLKLLIDNPNYFPVTLSALRYELYGAGRFWADGTEEEILEVPPGGRAETEVFLVMNFINMDRNLFNQVTTMRQVPYRFAGEAVIGTGVDYLPQFRMDFDRSGVSQVVK